MTATKQASWLDDYANGYRPYVKPSPEAYQQYGKEMLQNFLLTAGLTGGGVALYKLLNGAKKVKPLVAETDDNSLDGKAASDGSFVQKLEEALGRLQPKQFIPEFLLGGFGGGGEHPQSMGIGHSGWRAFANTAAALGGGIGGVSLVNAMSAKHKKQELEDDVEDARKQYMSALTGKAAQALDLAYETLKQAQDGPAPSLSEQAYKALARGFQTTAEFPWQAALLTALGTGTVGAKYMYDQTKKQTQAENLRKAQASKARLQSINQSPWIDPEELAAIAGR